MITINRNNPTPGEITSSLTNSADGGAGLHFDGTGSIDIATVPDLGTKFSYELIIQGVAAGGEEGIIDFGTVGRLWFGIHGSTDKLGFYDTGYRDFSVLLLDDQKVHHLVVTIDGTAAILYDNGNQVSTVTLGRIPDVDDCTDAAIGSNFDASTKFNGTMYRARLWNKTLSQAEVTATFENSTVPFGQLGTTQAELITNGNFASASGWTLGTGWTVASNKATSDGSQSATSNIYRSTAQTVVLGKNYRVTYTVSGRTAGEVWVNIGGNTNLTKRSTNETFTEEIVTVSSVTSHIYIQAGVDFVGSVTDITVTESGAVSDYDLAFAQPEISTIIQDRAGAADGTSSATGVTQVTPIEAVNTNKLNVGGTTPLVGIGLAAGTTPAAPLHIQTSAVSVTPDTSADNLVVMENGNAGISIISGTSNTGNLTWGDTTNNMAAISYSHGTNDMSFRVNSTNDVLTLDSAGNAGLGVAPVRKLGVHEASSSGVYTHYTNTTTGTTSEAGFVVGIEDAEKARVWNYHGTDMEFGTSNTTRMTIASTGAVTMPSTPAFNVNLSTAQLNFATGAWVKILFDTERFDQGGNFDTVTNTFTAPVTGKYQLNVSLRLENVDAAAGYYEVRIATSNKDYNWLCDLRGLGSDSDYWPVNLSVLADMDSSDTSDVSIYQYGGTAQTDVNATQSTFSGFLAC